MGWCMGWCSGEMRLEVAPNLIEISQAFFCRKLNCGI